MTRLLLAALAAFTLGIAWAGEKPATAPAEKAAETGERKATAAERRDRQGGSAQPSKGKPRSKTAPEKQKPCAVVRPCPID